MEPEQSTQIIKVKEYLRNIKKAQYQIEQKDEQNFIASRQAHYQMLTLKDEETPGDYQGANFIRFNKMHNEL